MGGLVALARDVEDWCKCASRASFVPLLWVTLACSTRARWLRECALMYAMQLRRVPTRRRKASKTVTAALKYI
jgi:hypothetical protein